MSSDVATESRPQEADGHSARAAPIRVAIADDHAHYREGLGLILALDGDIEVVGAASNGFEALDLVLGTRPDVLIIDLQMPRLGGIDVVRALADQAPGTRVVMLTMSEQNADLLDALLAGANGYVIKAAAADEVAAVVRLVHGGAIVVTTPVIADVVSQMLSTSPEDPRIAALLDANRALLRRVARGAGVDEIAAEVEMPRDAVVAQLRQLLDDCRALIRQ